MSWISQAKNTLKNRQKWQDDRGLNLKKNYSSFWMDDDKYTKFSGLSTHSSSTDLIKLVKLLNYRKAVSNFVKIVAKREIPVTWSGSNSYTNGESINITSEIKDTNFDVVVGLALHEASHIILSDFKLLEKLGKGELEAVESLIYKSKNQSNLRLLLKQLLNWIEDRRIDNFIFSTSPGYKAYYHKMYDHYWNCKDIHRGLMSPKFRDERSEASWLFQIVNSLNPSFNPNAMPGLKDAIRIINVRDIKRLQSTEDALSVALEVLEIIMHYIEYDDQKGIAQPGEEPSEVDMSRSELESGGSSDGGQSPENEEETEDDSAAGDAKEEDNEKDETGDQSEAGDAKEEEIEPLTAKELASIQEAFKKQQKFLEGELDKKDATKKLQRALDVASKGDMTVQTVGEGFHQSKSALITDFTNTSLINNYIAIKEAYSKPNLESKERKKLNEELIGLGFFNDGHFLSIASLLPNQMTLSSIKTGLESGALLGKKLQIHSESRERVDNRLRNGKIDIKRIAHAGYGIESIFKQIHVDAYKHANIHISIDASGSMGGIKWQRAISTTIAIAKALTYTQNIQLQVSLRYTGGHASETPTIYMIYNSKKNKLQHLVNMLTHTQPTKYTPEGLCFEALYKQNLLVPGSNDLDSYFINFSDGEPACGSYIGQAAYKHTQKWVEKMRTDLNLKILSFFLTNSSIEAKDPVERASQLSKLKEDFNLTYTGKNFRLMYGKDAVAVDTNSVMEVAKSLNGMFLSSKVN